MYIIFKYIYIPALFVSPLQKKRKYVIFETCISCGWSALFPFSFLLTCGQQRSWARAFCVAGAVFCDGVKNMFNKKKMFIFAGRRAGFSHFLMCWSVFFSCCFCLLSWFMVVRIFSSLNGTFILCGRRSALRWLKKWQFHFCWQAHGIFAFVDVSKVWVFILFFCVVVHVFPYFSFNKRLIVLFNCFSVTRLFLYLLYMFPFLFSFAGGWRGGVAIATFSPRLSCYATCTRARPFPLFTWSLRRRARLKKTPVSVKRGHVFFLEIKKNMRVIAVSCRSVEGVQYAPLRNVSGAFWTTPARVISCRFWLVCLKFTWQNRRIWIFYIW